MAKQLTKQHSSYWLGDIAENDDLTRKGDSIAEAMRLVTLKRSVASFVRIVTGESYPVVFSSGQRSFTDGKTVVLSASKSDTNFDSLVGLALHEASHILLSDFKALELIRQYDSQVYPLEDVRLWNNKFEASHLGGSASVSHRMKTFYHTIFNVLEDRRIDYFIYRTAPGYRPYYEAMYDRYFRSPQVDKAMRENRVRQPTVENYLFHLINMINPLFDTRVLPDLDKIYGLASLDTLYRLDADPLYREFEKNIKAHYSAGTRIPFEKIPSMWQLVFKIGRVIIENSIAHELRKDEPVDQPDGGTPSPDGTAGEGESESCEGGDREDNLDDMVNQGSGPAAESDEDADGQSGDSGADGDDDAEDEDEAAGGADGDDDAEAEDESESDVSRDREADEDSNRGKRGKFSDSAFDKAFKDQKAFVDNDVKKTKITKTLDRFTKALDSAGAEIEDVKFKDGLRTGSAQVVVLNRFDRDQVEYGTTPFTPDGDDRWSNAGRVSRRSRYYRWSPQRGTGRIENPRKNYDGDRFVANGFRMGRMLASKLAVRNQEQTRKYNRRPEGVIDRRRLSALGAGETNVFHHLRKTAYEPVFLHLSIDASGSMSGQKFNNAMALAIAVAVAADKIENLDVEISLRAGTYSMRGDNFAVIQIIYDSRLDKPSKIRTLFPYLDTTGCTPEGLCFAAISDQVIRSASKRDAYFVNLSDGQPYYNDYFGEAAVNHTREQMIHFRQAGIKVLSYFIAEGEREVENYTVPFKRMYGKSASFIDPASVTAISKTLNKLFLS